MKLGISFGSVFDLCKLKGNITFEEAAATAKRAGFDTFDFPCGKLGDDYRDEAQKLRQRFDELNVRINQTHCPFFRYEKEGWKRFPSAAMKAVEITATLGARFLVVHADESIATDSYVFDDILAFTYEYLAPVVEYAEKLGVCVAIEDLFEHKGVATEAMGGRYRFTSSLEELLAIVDKFNSTHVGVCWDFGHGNLSFGAENANKLRTVGKRLMCTHVHDNFYGGDLHLPPFYGTINWQSCMNALRDIGYDDVLSFELEYTKMPDELIGRHLETVHKIGDVLLSMYHSGK